MVQHLSYMPIMFPHPVYVARAPLFKCIPRPASPTRVESNLLTTRLFNEQNRIIASPVQEVELNVEQNRSQKVVQIMIFQEIEQDNRQAANILEMGKNPHCLGSVLFWFSSIL